MTHVLIVEDHEENRDLLKLLLEVNGYRVTAAGDGLEALAAARRDPPDAVVSDVLMQREDLIGTPVDALYANSSDRDAILKAIKQFGRAIDVDAAFKVRDGSHIPCSVSATMVRGADNEARIVATWRDISRRKEIERELED